VLDLSVDAADGAGVSWLHRHTEVMEKALDKDGHFAMTVRVEPGKADAVRAKFEVHSPRL
jgi:GTP-binding protein HflX